MLVSTGTGAMSVNVRALLVLPAASETVTLFAPTGALSALVNVAVTEVPVGDATMLVTVMFAPAFTEVIPARPAPLRVTLVVAPALADVTVVMLVRPGLTVNVT